MEEISILVGKTCTDIFINTTKDKVIFRCYPKEEYIMYHGQDCCETVYLEDICGDLGDLINCPILMAEKVTDKDLPAKEISYENTHTWTFYKFRTRKGDVTLRWYGTSNGYYSEEVSFARMN